MDVVCVGDCGVDHYLPSHRRLSGGITANFARHARKEFPAGDKIRIVSCVGTDDAAPFILSSLKDSGIGCHISTLPGSTPVQYIEIESNGERRFVRYDEGVLRDFSFGREERRVITKSDLLVAPVYLQIVDLFDELMGIETDGRTAIDFADFLQHPDFSLLERHIDNIDIAFFGLSPGDEKTIDRIAAVAAKYGKLFVVTLGASGSRAFAGNRRFDCSAVPVDNVVDTTGAGDAFAAGFLASYCHGPDIPAAMQNGAKLASTVVANIGSWS
jgi:sugar/nucleoside kinase (ribokinase family)